MIADSATRKSTKHPGAPTGGVSMSRGYGFWPDYIRSHFIRQIDLYAAVLRDRLLPAFDNLNEEAQKIEDAAYERLYSRSSSEDPDIALLGQMATEEAADYLGMMEKMKQAQINLQTLGLYHLFEQQICEIHRRLEFSLGGMKATAEIKLRQVKDALLADGIAIEKLPAWSKVNELRIVANCAKHAEGDSCQQLRQLRPELLTPSLSGAPARLAPVPVVLNPLGGESLYVTLQDFEEYVTSLKSFWLDLATALPSEP